MPIKSRIRTIPDYPKPGIQFRDITTLLQDAEGMHMTVEKLVEPYRGASVDKVVGIEARGFILGGAVAHQLRSGFVPARKKGKLPYTTVGQDYELEYGSERIEMHTDAIVSGETILLVDDLVATGGTALAVAELIRKAGGEILGCVCIVDLPDLGGSRRLREAGVALHTLCQFEGD
jgi:adenine phosphoribosyltransferase